MVLNNHSLMQEAHTDTQAFKATENRKAFDDPSFQFLKSHF